MWGGTRDASEKVAARPTCGAVRRDCWEKSFSFVHSAYLAVTMGVHDHCRGEGGGYKEELLRRPLGRSNGGDDKNAIDVPLHSLQRDSDNGGTPAPRCSYDNTPKLTDSY